MGPSPLVVMGVSASGKSTVGVAFADRLGVAFADGDDFHPEENLAKMRAGRPLDDADRRPWLRSLGRWLAEHSDGGVLGCSALKRAYRDQLRERAPHTTFLLLDVSPEVLRQRSAARSDHFMPPSLLDSQLADLEPLSSDERGFVIDADQSVDAIVEEYLRRSARES